MNIQKITVINTNYYQGLAPLSLGRGAFIGGIRTGQTKGEGVCYSNSLLWAGAFVETDKGVHILRGADAQQLVKPESWARPWSEIASDAETWGLSKILTESDLLPDAETILQKGAWNRRSQQPAVLFSFDDFLKRLSCFHIQGLPPGTTPATVPLAIGEFENPLPFVEGPLFGALKIAYEFSARPEDMSFSYSSDGGFEALHVRFISHTYGVKEVALDDTTVAAITKLADPRVTFTDDGQLVMCHISQKIINHLLRLVTIENDAEAIEYLFQNIQTGRETGKVLAFHDWWPAR